MDIGEIKTTFRRELLNNKAGCCPNCDSKKYWKHGIDKGSQRYYCNNCNRTFTEYTGTWLAGIHKKELVGDYLKLMEQELSLDKIREALGINKKTAFDWRHKILSGLENADKEDFNTAPEPVPESENGTVVVSSLDQKFLREALEVVESNMDNTDFNIPELCSELGMSRSTLYRKLHVLTGMSPVKFTRSLRLKRAASLLKQQFGNVSVVALEVGFQNPSYFSRLFRQSYEISPSKFAKSK